MPASGYPFHRHLSSGPFLPYSFLPIVTAGALAWCLLSVCFEDLLCVQDIP